MLPLFGSYLYLIAYLLALSSIIAVTVSLLFQAKKKQVPLSMRSLRGLAAEEARRLFQGNAVFLMHLAIVVGVGLTILLTVIDPFTDFVWQLRLVLLVLAIPVAAGLLVALVWRFARLVASRKVQSQLGATLKFSRSSTYLQLVLILTITLAILQIALEWVGAAIAATGTDAIKNSLIAIYYAVPAVNLLKNFQKPIPEITMPFALKDIVEGKVDPTTIVMGVTTISQFKDYERSSLQACIEIGACEAACPATAVGRPLSPRMLVRKLHLSEKSEGDKSEVFNVIGEDELWACTTCAACVNACPVGVRHVDMIVDMRRSLVAANKLDKKKSDLLMSLNQQRNSLGAPNGGRNMWLEELGMRTVEENPKFEYLLWVGCMSSFDEGSKPSVRALAEILKRAGVLDRFAILGESETCCGDPARRLGEESLFQEMALANIEIFKKYGVKKLVLTCPHGCNTFTSEYPKVDAWMKSVTVYHQAQLLEELVSGEKLAIRNLGESITIHDPCYLARYQGVVKPQRKLISQVGELKESHHHGEDTFCCGAGGANYWYEVPEKKRISHERIEQLERANAGKVVTMCPFCNAMLKDAAKTRGLERLQVTDIAEVVQASLTQSQDNDVN